MITRQQIAEAYQCGVNVMRPILRSAGITHQRSLSLEEFREVIKRRGWPIDKKYQEMAELAMNSPIENADSSQKLQQLLRFFPGIKNT